MFTNHVFVNGALSAANAAAEAILPYYHASDFTTAIAHRQKADDSPVTEADFAAHRAVVNALEPFGLPVVSEEDCHSPYEVRQSWDSFWLADPLDGTCEFVQRGGEFTVNIALVHHGRPVLGVVVQPTSGEAWAGGPPGYMGYEGGAWHKPAGTPDWRKLPSRNPTPPEAVGALRKNGGPAEANMLQRVGICKTVRASSALKLCWLADGRADVYYRHGATTYEWDTAAAEALLLGIGGVYVTENGPLRYNKPQWINPPFWALANPNLIQPFVRWRG